MPIQSLNIGKYNQIPDDEDVTPLDRSIQKKEQRNWKAIAICGGLTIIIGVLVIFFKPTRLLYPQVQVFQTSMLGDRLSELTPSIMASQGFPVNSFSFRKSKCSLTSVEELKNCFNTQTYSFVNIDSSKHYQNILGFGGAFTEASAINFFKLSESVQQKFIDMYFGPNGIGYSLGRVHINSCDFSPKSYSFDEIENDFDLKYFDNDVTHDQFEMIPFIKRAMSASKQPIRLLASPWSPPSWMKYPQSVSLPSDPLNTSSSPVMTSIQSMTGSATPSGLKHDPRVRRAWALYLSKFLSSYKSQGVPFWALTPQNEPEFPAPWEACAFNASDERSFVDHYLGPVLRQTHPDLLILAFDHNKDHLKNWTLAMLDQTSPSSSYLKKQSTRQEEYVDGMAFHWYTGGGDRVLDGTYGYDNVNFTHHYRPDKVLLASEGCSCPGVKLDDWLRAERLAHDVIFDLNNHAQGWIDWNLLVDYQGGPNHLNNFCDAPIITTEDYSDIHLQPKFYFMGHISKFLPPGSVRISSEIVGDFAFAPVDPNVRAGIEVQLFHCERSSRQQWVFNSLSSALELKYSAIDSESTEGATVRLCLGKGDENRPFMKLVVCDAHSSSSLSFRLTKHGQLLETKSQLCVGIPTDVREPGAPLTLLPCTLESPLLSSSPTDDQLFRFNSLTGEIQTPRVRDLCLTAGWPFLTGVAALQPSTSSTSSSSFWSIFSSLTQETESISVVLLNEAQVGASVLLSDLRRGVMNLYTPPKSIQTLVY